MSHMRLLLTPMCTVGIRRDQRTYLTPGRGRKVVSTKLLVNDGSALLN